MPYHFRFFFCLFFIMLFFVSVLSAQPGAEKEKDSIQSGYSATQHDLGIVVLMSLEVKDGKLIVSAATGGCTEKSSFTVHIVKMKGITPESVHYTVTIERIVTDDCKGFFPGGVIIEYDLGKEFGIYGAYSLSVINPVSPQTGM